MKRFPFVLAALALVLGLLARADAQSNEKLVVTWGTIEATNTPIWVAYKSGLFAKNGLDVDLEFQASSLQIASVLSGNVQIANVGGGEVVSADASGGDLVILAVLGPVFPYLFMVPNDIKTVAQLKGKKVGVSQFGDSSYIGAQLGLRRMGLDTKDVTYIAVGSSTNRAAALMNGAIQGGVVSPPMDLELAAHGLHTLFDLSKLNIPAVNVTITARRSWVNTHREVVQKYVDSIVAGIMREKNDKAFTIDVLRQYYKIDDLRELNECYAFYARVTPALPYPRAEQFTQVLQELANTNEKVRGFDVSKILDDSFVRRAAQDLKIKG